MIAYGIPAKQFAYDVYIGALLIDTVFFDYSGAREARKALIDHDGLPSTISVYQRAVGRHAYSDCARASKPEEC